VRYDSASVFRGQIRRLQSETAKRQCRFYSDQQSPMHSTSIETLSKLAGVCSMRCDPTTCNLQRRSSTRLRPFFLVFVSQSLTGLRLKEQGERPQTSQQPEIAPVVTSVAFDPAHRRSDHEARPNVLVFVCLRVDSKMPRYFRRKICISRRTSLLEDTLSRRRKCHLSTRGAELPLLLNEGERQPRPISLIRPLHSDEPDRVRRLRVRIRMRCACLLDTANGR